MSALMCLKYLPNGRRLVVTFMILRKDDTKIGTQLRTFLTFFICLIIITERNNNTKQKQGGTTHEKNKKIYVLGVISGRIGRTSWLEKEIRNHDRIRTPDRWSEGET